MWVHVVVVGVACSDFATIACQKENETVLLEKYVRLNSKIL